jgi:hypothetical protein
LIDINRKKKIKKKIEKKYKGQKEKLKNISTKNKDKKTYKMTILI